MCFQHYGSVFQIFWKVIIFLLILIIQISSIVADPGPVCGPLKILSQLDIFLNNVVAMFVT